MGYGTPHGARYKGTDIDAGARPRWHAGPLRPRRHRVPPLGRRPRLEDRPGQRRRRRVLRAVGLPHHRVAHQGARQHRTHQHAVLLRPPRPAPAPGAVPAALRLVRRRPHLQQRAVPRHRAECAHTGEPGVMDHRARGRQRGAPLRHQLAQRGAPLAPLVRLQPHQPPVDPGRRGAVLRDLGSRDDPVAPPAPACRHPGGGSHRLRRPDRAPLLVVVELQPRLLRDRHPIRRPLLRGPVRLRRLDQGMALPAHGDMGPLPRRGHRRGHRLVLSTPCARRATGACGTPA